MNEILNPPRPALSATLAPGDGMPHGTFRLEKRWAGESDPFEVLEWDNAYVNAGGALLLDLLIGAGGTAFNAANAHAGAGDGGGAVVATTAAMTDLQGTSNTLRKAMDATFPSRSGQVVTFQALFGTGDANFAWNEMAIFNAASGGVMLCRTGQAMGTKTSAAQWTFIYTLTVP